MKSAAKWLGGFASALLAAGITIGIYLYLSPPDGVGAAVDWLDRLTAILFAGFALGALASIVWLVGHRFRSGLGRGEPSISEAEFWDQS